MDWLSRFQLFLFDFDGLLVNTEHLHYQAYVQMLAARGFRCEWSFSQFCTWAHRSSEALQQQIYLEFPNLEPNWNVLYKEKKEIYHSLIASGKVGLMPGAAQLLERLAKDDVRRCVVTNSFLEQTRAIAAQQPILRTIPHWITREDYEQPKPHPECYLHAIQLFGKQGDRIIGFEDTLRGLKALQQTPALAVLVCSPHHPLLEIAVTQGVLHFSSLEEVMEEKPTLSVLDRDKK